MTEPYQEEPYDDEYYYDEPAPRQGMSGWLIALIVILVIIVLCCVCACVAGLLWAYATPSAGIGNVFSTIIESMTPMP